MSRARTLSMAVAATLLGAVPFARPAVANTQEMSVVHVHESYVERNVCSFDLRVHLSGSFKSVDFRDRSGFLYKTIDTPGGGGPFTVRYTAHGTTLTQQSEAYSVVLRYAPDGSVSLYTQRGPVARFTVRGTGIVLLDVGLAIFEEPSEILLFAGGPHQAVEGDFDAFCAAFG